MIKTDIPYSAVQTPMPEDPNQPLQSIIDDRILDCFNYEPHYSEWVLVKERADPMQFFTVYSLSGVFRCVPSSDCLEIFGSDDDDTIGIIGISTITTGAAPTYLVSLNLYQASVHALIALDVFKNIASKLEPLMFHDSAILQAITLQRRNHNDIVHDYLYHPDRSRPVFIQRNATSLGPSTRTNRKRSNLLASLGPFITNTPLFAEWKPDGARRHEILCVLPDHEVLLFDGDYLSSFEGDIDALFLAQEQFAFDECPATTDPISPAALKLWGIHNLVPIPDLAELNRRAESDYLEWYAVLERADNRRRQEALAAAKATAPVVPAEEPEREPEQSLTKEIAETSAPAIAPLGVDQFPASGLDIAAWAGANFADRLAIVPRAARALAKSRHPNPERIARAIAALANEKHACYQVHDRPAAIAAFEQRLQDLYMRDTFSNAERLVGRTGNSYVVTFEGRRLLLERHLASQSSGFNQPSLIRIYYTYDRPSGKIVIGYLPDHLPTSIK